VTARGPIRTVSFAAAVVLSSVVSSALATGAALAHRDDLDSAQRKRAALVLQSPQDFSKPEAFETLAGGAATVRDKALDADIFSQPSSNLDFEARQRFQIGNGLFRKDWVSAPSSTQASDGLGPLFNARSCQGCHLKDGRGIVPEGDEAAVSLFLRLSVPPRSDAERAQLASGERAVIPEPTYGGQLQNFAVAGLRAEGRMTIRWHERSVELAGGESASLRVPEYAIGDFGFGPPQDDLMISPRIASPMPGLGLLAAIHERDVLAHAERTDDVDGVSGKPAWSLDPQTGKRVLGRFGWKAGQPSIASQAAHAFAGDMGLSTPLLPDPYGDCSDRQAKCRELPHGVQSALGAEEVPGDLLDFVSFYSANLAVPARRDADDPSVLSGKQQFHAARCTSCHVPKYVTRADAEQPEHRFQLIWPYTDLLLHDMGEGLADHRPEGQADGREWRTPPLWGIGLTRTVNPRASFLHDGRARSLLEAILWHDGEAAAARDRVVGMTPQQRADLIRFIESL
jgi:CxxC motif-containing protein (DUF1111 family)